MDTLSPLLGESPSPELVEHIEHTVMSYPEVLGVHDLMVHDYGPGHQFASLHIELPAEAGPAGSPRHHRQHRAGFSEERPLTGHHPLRPIVTSDAAVGVLRSRLMEKARQMDPACHPRPAHRAGGQPHQRAVRLVFPAGYTGDKDARLAEMEQFRQGAGPGILLYGEGGAEL